MHTQEFRRKLTAIMSLDAVGYSRLMGQDEAATVRTITAHRMVITAVIQKYRGRVVDSPGDNMLAEFVSVVDAVQSAVEIQEVIRGKNAELPEDRRMEFRIGINLGDVIEEGERIYGDGVNIAARLEGLAEPGGICISGSAYEQIESKLSLGYEFIGEHPVKNIVKPVRAYKVPTGPKTPQEISDKKILAPKWKRVALAGAIAMLVAAGGAAIWKSYRPPSPPTELASVDKMAFPLPDRPSIAVLPFSNMSGDAGQDYFTDGFTEQIITSLSKTSSLFVISRNSSFTYKGKPVKVQKVSEDLGVQYVLEGSIQKSGDHVRINTQLIDAISGKHLWAEYYDRNLTDIFALQDEIILKIVTALQVNLATGEQARVYAKGTKNLQAYLKLMQAREAYIKGDAAGNALARQLVEEAMALDPQYALAYMMMGTLHNQAFLLGSSPSPRDSLMQGIEWLERAVAMDDSLAEAHARLGHSYTFVKRHDEAIAEAEKAIVMDPNSAAVHFMAGLVLRFSGKPAESIPVCKKSIRLEPVTPGIYYGNLAMAYFQNRSDCDEAVKACEKAIKLAPDAMIVQFMATTVFSWCGKEKEAREAAKDLLRINPKFTVESFAAKLPYKDPKEKEPVVEALRKAGL
jgi:adenylate cyclase